MNSEADKVSFDVPPQKDTIPPGPAFVHVRLGLVAGRLAVFETKTNEPLQFVVGTGTHNETELQWHTEKICRRWEELFLSYKDPLSQQLRAGV